VRVTESTTGLSHEEQLLWKRVNELWALSLTRDPARIRSALHPLYVGWDMSSPSPHDRELAVNSVVEGALPIVQYKLQPLSVRVYDNRVGVVHYRYTAIVVPKDATPVEVTGGWTEVYLKESQEWIMIAVSGRPDRKSDGKSC
jgi:hypothetical protein